MNSLSHRCFQTQSIQQPIKNIRLKRYFFSPRGKNAKAFIQKNSIRTKSLAIVFFYDSTLQQCRKVSLGIITHSASQFPAVLHTASLFSQNLFWTNVTSQSLQVRSTEGDCGHPEIRKPIRLVKGVWCGSNCEKKNLTDVAGQKKNASVGRNAEPVSCLEVAES